MRQLHVVDSTLRDGEQMPGLCFSTAERERLLALLKKTGVSAIEIPGPTIDCRSNDAAWLNDSGVAIIAWNRSVPSDIDLSLKAGFRHIHISLPVSDAHIQIKLGKTFSWVLGQLCECIKIIRTAGAHAYVGAEDASRASDRNFLEYANQAATTGAVRIRFADTVGRMNPFECYDRLRNLRERCPIPMEYHGHNDFGMAVANSVAAYRAGVDWHSGTVAGIGERAGNSNLRGLFDWLSPKVKDQPGFSERALCEAETAAHNALQRAGRASGLAFR